MLGEKSTLLQNIPGVKHLFMGRKGGTSPKPWDSLNVSYDLGDVKERVSENRARVCAMLGISPRALYDVDQVHGTHVVRVSSRDDPNAVRDIEADAIWTTDAGIAVAVQTADCAPILLVSDDGQVVAAIHAGWRGAVAGIAPMTVEVICKELGLKPQQIVAAVGPCIGFDAFEVGPEVVAAFKPCSFASEVLRPGTGDRWHVDLGGFVKKQLEQMGVTRVELLGRCTVTHNGEYFSYRGGKGKRGGQMSVICRM